MSETLEPWLEEVVKVREKMEKLIRESPFVKRQDHVSLVWNLVDAHDRGYMDAKNNPTKVGVTSECLTKQRKIVEKKMEKIAMGIGWINGKSYKLMMMLLINAYEMGYMKGEKNELYL
jgi:hypothetical protein